MTPEPTDAHVRILLLSEDLVFRATALAALQRAGHVVDGHGSAAEALEAARLGAFACGVLDLDLADPAAKGLLRRLRALASRTPLVVLTEPGDPEHALWALRHGATEVVAKPVSSANLCAVVRRVASEAQQAAAHREDDPPERAARAPRAAAPRAHEAGPPASVDPPPPEGRRRVLVVDDDSLVGKGIRVILGDFEVVFAQSAAGALGRVASGRGFAAAICDFRMPGMDGIQFHEALERLDPGLARRLVFITGWSDAPEFRAFLRRTSCDFLPKPFDPEDLRRAVERACQRDGS